MPQMVSWSFCNTWFFFFQAEDGIRDLYVTWSSDVCSSDLVAPYATDVKRIAANHRARITGPLTRQHGHRDALLAERTARPFDESLRAPVSAVALPDQIGRASCRERVWISVEGEEVRREVEE